jgi:CBS domain containing-hemolysin-like protein
VLLLCAYSLDHGTFIEQKFTERTLGYVVSLIERIPRQGESVETNELRITVLDADARRVRRVGIHRKVQDIASSTTKEEDRC